MGENFCWHTQLLWVQLHSSGYHFPKEQPPGAPEVAFHYVQFYIFYMTCLHYLLLGSIMITAINVIPCNENDISYTKYIWCPWRFHHLCQNISPVGTTPNGSLVNLYLPNWHANVVNYEDFLLSFTNLHWLWSYNAHLLFWEVLSFIVGQLCTGPISACICLVGHGYYDEAKAIWPFLLLQVVLVFGNTIVFLVLSWMALAANMLCALAAPDMTLCHLWPVGR